MTFRILDFFRYDDEGSFPLGGAGGGTLITKGSIHLATLAAIVQLGT